MRSRRIDLPREGEGTRRLPAALKEEIVLATLEAGTGTRTVQNHTVAMNVLRTCI